MLPNRIPVVKQTTPEDRARAVMEYRLLRLRRVRSIATEAIVTAENVRQDSKFQVGKHKKFKSKEGRNVNYA